MPDDVGVMNFDARAYTGMRLTFQEVTSGGGYSLRLVRNDSGVVPFIAFAGALAAGTQTLEIDFANPTLDLLGSRQDIDEISLSIEGQATLTRIELVPEPPPITAMGLGLAALLRRRRAHKA